VFTSAIAAAISSRGSPLSAGNLADVAGGESSSGTYNGQKNAAVIATKMRSAIVRRSAFNSIAAATPTPMSR